MSLCNILDNLAKQFGSIFGESQRLIYAQPPVSGIGLVPGRTIYGSLCGVRNASRLRMWGNSEKLVGSLYGEKRLDPTQGYRLAGASYILCKLTNYPITMPYTLQKLGCSIISYRTLIRLFYRQFIGSLSAKLRLSLNRDTPTPLLNLYPIYFNSIFVTFYYPEGDTKSTLGGAKC